MAIDVLPGDLLLEVFDLYRERETHRPFGKPDWGWTTLAHVCRRWRGIILASPQRLRLRITCTPMTPVETCLDIWPPFPIAIICFPSSFAGHKFKGEGEQNIIAALEHRERISDIHILDPDGSSLERWLVAMQEPLQL